MTPVPSKISSQVSVDVVIPVLNEAHVLATKIEELRGRLSELLSCRWRIIIVDNGSTDGTLEAARRLTSEHQDVVFLHLDQRGRGRALRLAWTQSPADVVCYMDVDLSTELDALPRALHAILKEGFDLAVGSRLMRESQTRRSMKREFISQVYNMLLKVVLHVGFSDAQCGFKAVSHEVVGRIVPQIKDQGWFFDTELLVLSERQGYRVKDLPVMWNEDNDSRVKIIQTAWDDIKGVFRLRKFLWSREFTQAAVLHGKQACL
jgi:glycosyltransferase involved in cell wall biosynthesis